MAKYKSCRYEHETKSSFTDEDLQTSLDEMEKSKTLSKMLWIQRVVMLRQTTKTTT